VRRLSGLDAAFLALETPSSTGHVGGLSVVDPSTAPVPLTLATLTPLLQGRLAAVPVMRQRLMEVPLGLDQPVWVDDEHFDIGYHVRELGLPTPGTTAQLAEQVARIHARPLDRSRPLWELYLISGLEGGRAAVYTKIHHAAIDGVSGAELLTVLYDLDPAGRPGERDGPPEPFAPRTPPSRLGLLTRTATRVAGRPYELGRVIAHTVTALPGQLPVLGPAVAATFARSPDGGVLTAAPLPAPRTPLNVSISPHRRFAPVTLSLPDVKRVKNAFGVSVNDVVMAISAGALRRWLLERDALPETPLVAMVPVSIRQTSSDFKGNKVSAMLATLPTHVADPVERLGVAHRSTVAAKAQQAAVPQGLVDQVTDFSPPALTGRVARMIFGSRVLNRLPAFNVVVSNVPGPNVPVYLAGAELLHHYPLSAVTDGMALNITLIGYRDGLDFGLVAAREVVPDLDTVAGHLAEELDLLVAATEERERRAARRGSGVSGRRAAGTAPTSAAPPAGRSSARRGPRSAGRTRP
jgi:WS/DGAT/MGAT family acyltransferase